MSGQIPRSTGNLPGGLLSAIKAGKVRALEVTTAKHGSNVPGLPTSAESGVPAYEMSGWHGIRSPKLSKSLAMKMNADLVNVLSTGSL